MSGLFSSVFNGDDNDAGAPTSQEATNVDLEGNPAGDSDDADSGKGEIEDPGLEPVTGIIAPVEPVPEDGTGDELMG